MDELPDWQTGLSKTGVTPQAGKGETESQNQSIQSVDVNGSVSNQQQGNLAGDMTGADPPTVEKSLKPDLFTRNDKIVLGIGVFLALSLCIVVSLFAYIVMHLFANYSVAKPTLTVISSPASLTNTDSIGGDWTGTIFGVTDSSFSTHLDLFIQKGCSVGNICGTYSTPQLSCSGSLLLEEINGNNFVFIEHNKEGANFCSPEGREYIRLLSNGTLYWRRQYYSNSGINFESKTILTRP